MTKLFRLFIFLFCIVIFSFGKSSQKNIDNAQEKHLKNLRQLTFGGDNAEAYWSPDGKSLTFQSNYKKWGLSCDQIFLMKIKEAKDSSYMPTHISNGDGRTTCSYFMPDGKHILFASTFKSGKDCPPTGDLHKGGKYLWPVFNSYDIYVADLNGNITSQLTDTLGYDAEAVVSPKGDKILFTSTRGGDLDLWTMNIDGTNPQQITHELGYDGGGFFSPDGTKIVFRASRPKTEEEIKDYKDLLAQGLVAPVAMEIFTCNVDGSDLKQITSLGKANWAPYYTHDGKKIIFSSNHQSTKGFDFQLFMINTDGTGLEQVTYESYFNSFPMFSPDGKRIAFSSNRLNGGTHDTNVFVADWVE
ncbi:MAG: PD40 domain-containing protein [Bacteroidetes bacterium]|nr:PD40 domain-containing protein [Bacteroidota bacterium]